MKKYYVAITLLLSGICVYFILQKPAQQKEENHTIHSNIQKEQERKQFNTVAYGLKDIDGNHIDNGSEIESEDNQIHVYVTVDHNIDEYREYGLIILENYKQKKFKVGNHEEEISKYFFDMNPKSSKKIKLSLPISKNASELAFLLIKKPSYQLQDQDINKAAILEEVLSMRYTIKNRDKVEMIQEIYPASVLTDGFNEPLFLTKSNKGLQITYSEIEEKELMISNGNETDEEMNYVILAFKDWEQYEIVRDKDYFYTTVAPQTRQLFSFTLPKVEKDSNFQLIAFPFPNKVSKENYTSQQAYGSFRMVIQPKT